MFQNERCSGLTVQATLKTVLPNEFRWKEECRSSLTMPDLRMVYVGKNPNCFEFFETIIAKFVLAVTTNLIMNSVFK